MLAEILQARLNEKFNLPDVGREYSALTADKYLLWKTTVPVVILECGFLSNPIDEGNFLDDEYRHTFGYEVAKGIAEYVYKAKSVQ